MSRVEGWTEGRYRSFITSAIRGGFRRFPNKYTVLKNAFTGKKKNKASGRIAAHYKCAECKKSFPNKEVQVDHINPVVDPVAGFQGWDVYIDRMYCAVENLQVLCRSCHKKKSTQERKERSFAKTNK